MKTPAWLAEFHRQWFAARGHNLEPASRPFSREWEKLLDDAGLHSAADRNTAEAEARQLATEGRLELRTHKYRTYLIEKVVLPLSQESWLVTHCGGTPAGDLRRQTLENVTAARNIAHRRWPESWEQLCDRLVAAFESGKNLAPFFWKDPETVRHLLQILRALTDREWPPGTLLRDASMTLTGNSKALEKQQGAIEFALGLLFGEESTLEALGILGSQSRALLHGRLCLHFPDGTIQACEHLQGEYTLSIADLTRAERASTGAVRILSIENARTTFRQAAAVNVGDTLIIATSYPNAATKKLLELLPPELPHYHFGDTDVSGYAILRALREICRRPVSPFLMAWQDKEDSPPLTEHDRRLLPALLASPLMSDCSHSLQAMADAGRKGCFEQEAFGAPARKDWPWWSENAANPHTGGTASGLSHFSEKSDKPEVVPPEE